MSAFFVVCAGLGGLILVVQVALSFFGLVESHEVQLEEGLDLLSVRAVSAGLAFFGIGGLAGLWLNLGAIGAIVLGVAVGAVALVGTAKLTRAMLKLESDRTPLIEETIGEQATVYLTIPARQTGVGKVHVSLRGRLVELAASTRNGAIPTGSRVTVVDTEGETLVVAPLTLSE